MDRHINKVVFVSVWLIVLKGQFFLSLVDTSNMSKTADNVFEMLDAIVERIGKENVVQVVMIMLQIIRRGTIIDGKKKEFVLDIMCCPL